MSKKIFAMTLLGMILTLSGCGGGSLTNSFMRKDASLAGIQTIAVLPFESHGGGTGAERIREFTMTQVLATGMFDVLDKGRVDAAMREEAIDPGVPIDAATLRRLGQALKVQAFILGSVEEVNESRGNASFPEITLTLRLVDSETGTLLWQASGRGSGYSLADRLFGMAPKDSYQVSMNLLRTLLATIK
jgi:TolB-like protein